MKLPNSKFAKTALGIAVLTISMFSNSANADYIYTYTSNIIPTESSIIDWDYGEIRTQYDGFLTAEIRTSTLLMPGMGIDDVTSLQMTSQGFNYEYDIKYLDYPSNPYSGYINGVLDIDSIDSNGLPTAWDISLDLWQFLGNREHSYTISTSTFRDYIGGYVQPCCGYTGTLLNNPGTWHMALVRPVPEPETYSLLVIGLGIIGSIARRRAHKRKF